MKIENLKIDNKIIHSNKFDNLFEMINYINTTESLEDYWRHALSVNGDASFTGTNSLEEAMDLCLNGYKDNFNDLISASDELKRLLPNLSNKRRTKSSVYGFRPNINKLMTGNPNSMYKLARKEETNFAHFYYDPSCSWATSTEAIMHKGIITIALIKLLEQLGNRIDLDIFEITKENEEYIYISVSLKSPGQLLDSSICNFPMCHPSFSRRINFAVKERIPVKYKDTWQMSYGSLCYKNEFTNILKPEKRSLLILEPHKINVFGNDIIEDTVNFIQETDFNKLLRDGQRLEFDEKQKRFIFTR